MKKIENPAPITSRKIQNIAGIGLSTPSKLTNQQIQELAASVERHIEPREATKKPEPKPVVKPKPKSKGS